MHSLSDREKRLYRRMAGQHLRQGKSNYLVLFDALAALPNFDVDALQKRIGDAALWAQLPTHISRLFMHITEFLRKADEFPSVDAQLNAACEHVAILYERGLSASARKVLKKAQKLARQSENYLQLLRIADLERTFFFSENARKNAPLHDSSNFQDTDFIKKLLQQLEVKRNHFEVLYFSKTAANDVVEAQALLQRVGGKSPQKAIRSAQASATDLMLLNAIGLASQLARDWDTAYAAYLRMDSLWVSNPDKISENAQLYISFITSFLNSCLYKARYVEFRSLLANLKTVRFQNEYHLTLLREALLYLELIYCLNRFEFDKGIALVPEIEHVLSKHQGRTSPSRMIAFYFNLASLHFMKGEFGKANKWITRIVHLSDQEYRVDIQKLVPVFQLLFFIAMDDQDLVSTRLRSWHRARDRAREVRQPLEVLIVPLAEKFLRLQPEEFRIAVAEFHSSLQQLIAERPNISGAGECLFWAEGRLKGKTPGEVFKEYAQSNNG